MSDQFQWWRDALAGKAGPINANEPQPGYFKLRQGKDGPWLPVAIWWNKDDELVCRVADKARDPHDVWVSCAGNPVAKDAAKQAFETGSWPGDVGIGHNSGDLSLADEIAEARDQALQWLTTAGVTDKVSADKAANYRARLLDLGKKADAERDAKVRPHLEAQKTINAEYKPLVEDAKAVADTLRAALSKYLAAEEEKARKAAAEAARVENEKRMAEYKRQQEAATKAAPKDEPPLPLGAPVFVAPEPVKLQAGGQRGKKASLRTITRYEITDYAAALAHVANSPDVRAAVEKAAFAQARAGVTVPGVNSYEERVAV
jgi:hypothetical protein